MKKTNNKPVTRGLRCPQCGCGHFRVLYTRETCGNRLLRRRECRHCSKRVTSYETISNPSMN